MHRRHFITLLGSAASWPFTIRAQQKSMPVIGMLGTGSPGTVIAPVYAAFREGLSSAGFVEGQNVTIEYRWAEGRYERLPALAAELVARNVDVIVAGGGAPPALAARRETSTIPIAFVSADPVGDGLVGSLSRPGGNLTGVSLLSGELMAKRLELISELIPPNSSIALLVNPANPNTERVIRDAEETTRTKGIALSVLKARSDIEIESAFAALVELHAGALIVQSDAFFATQRDQFVALAERHAVPAIYHFREFVAYGGLISYGASINGAFHQMGVYVGRILAGAKPADLPVEQPTKFELVINLKTAKALGLTVPQALLIRADEVIE